MGRWTQYDEDAYRLPAGFKRTGYDADTGQYTYSDRSGNAWTGAPYEEYGVMRRTGGTVRADAGSQSKFTGRSTEGTSDTKETADLSTLSNSTLLHRSQTLGGRFVHRTRDLAQRMRSKSVSAVRDRVPGSGGDVAKHEATEDEPKTSTQTEMLQTMSAPAERKPFSIRNPSIRRSASSRQASGSAPFGRTSKTGAVIGRASTVKESTAPSKTDSSKSYSHSYLSPPQITPTVKSSAMTSPSRTTSRNSPTGDNNIITSSRSRTLAESLESPSSPPPPVPPKDFLPSSTSTTSHRRAATEPSSTKSSSSKVMTDSTLPKPARDTNKTSTKADTERSEKQEEKGGGCK